MEETILSQNNNFDSYIKPFYSTLRSEKKDTSTKFSRALKFFLKQNPEFAKSQMHMDYLHYCLEHYINCDPEFWNLTLQEKLMRAGEMAKNFLSIINNSKA
jgi:hypothetical protein